MKRVEDDNKRNQLNIEILNDFFISNIFVWTLEDSKKYDEEHKTDFTQKYWCEDAIEQGYINIVQIAGFGTPNP